MPTIEISDETRDEILRLMRVNEYETEDAVIRDAIDYAKQEGLMD
jgi:Arc/MetJ-type ribon-helix-helix transcriptional regulator